jgi:hypothetical protein
MKKILLSVAFFATTIAFSQTLESENFNSLTLGNVGTDITGAAAGQGSYFTVANNGTAPTTSNNSNVTNFQIVANGNNSSNGIQIVSPNGDKGQRLAAKLGLAPIWAARTTGNNVIEVEYDFYTGPQTESRTDIGIRITGNETVIVEGAPVTTIRVLNGFSYLTNTRVLRGLAWLQNGASRGLFSITLATGGLILNADTWYKIGYSYNTVTGEVLWKTSPTANAGGMAPSFWVPNMSPTQISLVQNVVPGTPAVGTTPAVPANAATSSIIFDNYVCRASATSNLLNVEDFTSKGATIAIYPNPVTDLLNIKSDGSNAINAIQIVDLNGRQILSKTFNNVSDAQIDVNDLSSGMYLINITSGDKSVTKKFLKQ